MEPENKDSGVAAPADPPDRTLLILKPKLGGMKSLEGYMSNRGWTVFATDKLREGLAFLIQKKPSFLMIASDHPNPKVKLLPRLIAQAFKVHIIGFCESTQSGTLGALTALGLEYNLYPPVSGPAAERMIAKILKDAQSRPQQESTRISGKDDANLGQINEGKVLGDAKSALAALLSEPDPGDGKIDPGTMVFHGEKTEGNLVMPNEQAAVAGNYLPDQEAAAVKSGLIIPQSQGQKKPEPSITQSGIQLSELHQATSGHADSPTGAVEYKSILEQSTHDVLKDSSLMTGTEQSSPTAVGVATNVACVTIQSGRFKGYLITAFGNNRKIDAKFLKSIKDKLFEFLRVRGEPISDDGDLLDLVIQEVEFLPWAKQHAEFLRTGIHDANEVAMAFFPSENIRTELKASENSPEMLEISIEDLQDNTPMEFDLYIFMPENQKYLLYTPQGRRLMSEQKQRLLDKGVQQMHLRKENMPEVKKYKAQNFLNERISSYKNPKKSQ